MIEALNKSDHEKFIHNVDYVWLKNGIPLKHDKKEFLKSIGK